MALGTNRDYKTTDQRIRENLRIHKVRMDELMAQGMDKKSASKQAFNEMRRKN